MKLPSDLAKHSSKEFIETCERYTLAMDCGTSLGVSFSKQ